MRFKRMSGTIEAVVGVHPGVFRSVSPAIFARNRNARGGLVTGIVENRYGNRADRFFVALLPVHNLGLSSSRKLLHPQRRVAVAIGDEGDLLAVWRPARVRVVEVTVRNRQRVAASRRHHPEL